MVASGDGMGSLVVTDFDGCLVAENDKSVDAIHPAVADAVRHIDRRLPVIVVSARASDKAVAAARAALRQAGLAHIPFLCRDMARHDNSAQGIISAKVEAIEAYAAAHQLKPWIGIGDEAVDESVYQRLAMTIVRFAWPSARALRSAAGQVYDVDADRLPDAWRSVYEDLVCNLVGSNGHAGSDARQSAPEGD